MNKFTWWIRILSLAIAGGGLAVLIQHWSDGKSWPDAGASAVVLTVVLLLIAAVSRRTPRRHR